MNESSVSAPPPVTEEVSVNIAPTTEDAPPTLAEPASGPVAMMSGALQEPDTAAAPKPSVEGACTSVWIPSTILFPPSLTVSFHSKYGSQRNHQNG
jgi:hypothetical protein